MAKIHVDYRKLDRAADAIDRYIEKHKNRMNSANNAVEELGNSWSGDDYNATLRLWRKGKENGSPSEKMIRSLKNYSDFLRDTSKKYKDAQSRAVERANRLPRW